MKWGGLVSLHTLVHKAIAPGFDHTIAALLAEAPTHDVIVAHHFTFPAPVVAELTGLPWATVSLAPGVVPSAYSLPGANFGRAGRGSFGRAWNRFIWSAGKMITRTMVDPVVNRFRAKHGLQPVRDAIFEAHSPSAESPALQRTLRAASARLERGKSASPDFAITIRPTRRFDSGNRRFLGSRRACPFSSPSARPRCKSRAPFSKARRRP